MQVFLSALSFLSSAAFVGSWFDSLLVWRSTLPTSSTKELK